ncbi:hypothetical protein L873DRAFT_1815712 [Choiromyces venosus 120613-1]|uniref:Uncharacterized protein n=1 Tax=Choiromyces venosus 120613-1 TaxID=1336337 RepID=A0A3N4J950_9PEZI|nr:hypothetical protein L873DRAFT_1815712 [Choiromyces venosus 120613-1]
MSFTNLNATLHLFLRMSTGTAVYKYSPKPKSIPTFIYPESITTPVKYTWWKVFQLFSIPPRTLDQWSWGLFHI